MAQEPELESPWRQRQGSLQPLQSSRESITGGSRYAGPLQPWTSAVITVWKCILKKKHKRWILRIKSSLCSFVPFEKSWGSFVLMWSRLVPGPTLSLYPPSVPPSPRLRVHSTPTHISCLCITYNLKPMPHSFFISYLLFRLMIRVCAC